MDLWQTLFVSASGGVIGGVVAQLLSYGIERARWRHDDHVRQQQWKRDDAVQHREALRGVYEELLAFLDVTGRRMMLVQMAIEKGTVTREGQEAALKRISNLRAELGGLAPRMRTHASLESLNAYTALLNAAGVIASAAAFELYTVYDDVLDGEAAQLVGIETRVTIEHIVNLQQAVAAMQDSARRDLGHHDAVTATATP